MCCTATCRSTTPSAPCSAAPTRPSRRTPELARRISFRLARPEDFDYCARLYFAGMEVAIRQQKLDRDALVADLRQRWEPAQVRIVTVDGDEIGWLQSTTRDGAFFLVQLFVDAPLRGQDIGAEIMRRLIDKAAAMRQASTLGVVEANPAPRLYERLGFRVTHEDGRKFYMRRDPRADSGTLD